MLIEKSTIDGQCMILYVSQKNRGSVNVIVPYDDKAKVQQIIDTFFEKQYPLLYLKTKDTTSYNNRTPLQSGHNAHLPATVTTYTKILQQFTNSTSNNKKLSNPDANAGTYPSLISTYQPSKENNDKLKINSLTKEQQQIKNDCNTLPKMQDDFKNKWSTKIMN